MPGCRRKSKVGLFVGVGHPHARRDGLHDWRQQADLGAEGPLRRRLQGRRGAEAGRARASSAASTSALVTGVAYGAKSSDSLIYVKVDIKKTEAVRIRRGTKASVAMMGMLGDKMLVLKVARPGRPGDSAGGASRPTKGTTSSRSRRGRSSKVSARLDDDHRRPDEAAVRPEVRERPVGHRREPERDHDGDRATTTARCTACSWIPREGERIDATLANIDAATRRLAGMLGAMQDVSDHVRSGPGIAHAGHLRRHDVEERRGHARRDPPGPGRHPHRQRPRARASSTATTTRSTSSATSTR